VSADQQKAIEKAILDVHAEMKKAAENLDVEALYGNVLDEIRGPIIEDGRVSQTREEAFESTKRGLQGLSRLAYEYTQKHVTVLSPTLALWVGHGTASATLRDGREISAPFAETIVFAVKDGRWRVFHAHRSTPNAR
jgi:ketosteroid isomerase-like protein